MVCQRPLSDARVYERLVTHPLHPQLGFFLHLAVAGAQITVALLQLLGIVVDAALEHLVMVSQAAVRQAPGDPFLNGFLASAMAERDAAARMVSTRQDNWF